MLPPDPAAAEAEVEPSPLGDEPRAKALAAAAAGGGRHRRAEADPGGAPLGSEPSTAEPGSPVPADEDPAALAQRTLDTLLAMDPAASGAVAGGGWVARLAEPGARLGVMIGGALAVTVALFALFALAGVIFG